MCSGRALMVMAIVYEYVGSTTRPSPAITRVRSDDVIPQWPIQRRIGNQYRRATVNAMTNERIMIGLRGSCGERATYEQTRRTNPTGPLKPPSPLRNLRPRY